jgi:DNA repair exonuclease SbcCD nuclease subunit
MILFTADLHIKLGQKNVPIEWAKDRYKSFLKQLTIAEHGCDLHIMGGDVFDKLPSIEELEIFFEIVQHCRIRTLIYSGNHEATKKGKSFLSSLKKVVVSINPLVRIVDEVYEEGNFVIVPYEFIHLKKVWDNLDKSKIIFSHIRGEIPPHVKPEIDLDIIKDFPIVYLGDLHSHSNSQRNMVYPGSPMTTTFHRHKVETGYLHIKDTEWSWHPFNLPQLIRKTVTNQEDMIPTLPDHTIYEIEGNLIDLKDVKANTLLDKKVVKRSTDTSLILTKDMSITEELGEYFRFILELPEGTIKDIIGTYHDYYKKA